MWELQVDAAAVDVEVFAEQRAAHGRAFNVPAGAAATIGAVPFRVFGLCGFGGFPQHEVQWVVLAAYFHRIHCHALARSQLVYRLARQLAVAGELANRKIHVAV